MRSRLVLAVALSAFAASTASAQFPPERAKNLKVLPADMPVRALLDTMAGFTRALGVRCTYCHVGEEGKPLSTYDFASDEKPEKGKARVMLRMVGAVNADYLSTLPDRAKPTIAVSCATCHRGVTEPRSLQQVILSAYETGGVDSAESRYRALRQRYYGRASYDFSEVPLADVAMDLVRRGRATDAVKLSLLNTELSPTSALAFRQAADVQLAAGDTAAAVTSLEHALTINANDQQAKRALDRVRKKP